METPEKNTFGNNSLTPVKIFGTPPTPNNNNLVPVRLSQIVKTLDDTYTKWELSQTAANRLMRDVSRLNDRPDEIEEENLTEFYNNLEEDCEKIKDFLSTLHALVQTAKKSVDELRALWALSEFGYEIHYKSWNLQQFIKATERTAQMMEEEYTVKKIAFHEWTHASEKADLELHRSLLKYSDEYLNLRFRFHSIEKG